MRIWFKIIKDTKFVDDITVENYASDTRTHKVFNGLEEACHKMDLAVPIWLESNISEFKRSGKTRFSRDSFVEEIEFDYLEIEVLEEDY